MPGFSQYDGPREYAQQYPKTFIASKAFNNDFFTYTTSKNASFNTVGTLGYVTTDAARCPVGRVLHATGKKLYPNVNPMNTFPGIAATGYISGTTLTVVTASSATIATNMFVLGALANTYITSGSGGTGSYQINTANSQTLGSAGSPVALTITASLLAGKKFLMAVYDPISQLNGYIDPSSSIFAKYDQSLDNAFDLGPTANGRTYSAAQAANPLGGLAGKLTMAPDSGALTYSNPVNAKNAVIGSVVSMSVNQNDTFTVNTTACTTTSKVIITPIYTGGNQFNLSVTAIGSGSFTVHNYCDANPVSNGGFNWMIIN